MRSTNKGSASLYVVGMIAGLAIALAASLVWQCQSAQTIGSQKLAREADIENARISDVAYALVRRALIDNTIQIFSGITASSIDPLLTRDPRFSSYPASDLSAPGFHLTALATPPTPTLFDLKASFTSVPNGTPLAQLRHVVHNTTIPYTLARRNSGTELATTLASRSGNVPVVVREIPITAFSLVSLEDLNCENGFEFSGTSLVLGNSVQSPTMELRVSPVQVPDAQLGALERVWENPSIAASLMCKPDDIINPASSAPQLQSIAGRGKLLVFDGQQLSAESGLPQGIGLLTIAGSKRVVIDLNTLDQANTVLDASAPNGPDNKVSAFHIQCTTSLARDRGVVIVGTANGRICDIVTTNGALFFSGEHTGGPLFAASSFGGAKFLNTGPCTWNLYLALLCPSPMTTGTTGIITGARTFSLSDLSTALTANECSYDNVSIKVSYTPAGTPSVGFGTSLNWPNMYTPLASGFAEIYFTRLAGSQVQLNAVTTTGLTSSTPSTMVTTAPIIYTYSRTQQQLRATDANGSVFWALPAERPRADTSRLVWSPSNITAIDIIASHDGATLGATNAGQIGLNGLLTLGTISRYGPATFKFSPSSQASVLEKVVPRLLVIER